MSLVRRAFRLAISSRQPGALPADELLDQWQEQQNRRHFLRSAGQLGLAVGGLSLLNACRPETLVEPEPPAGARHSSARKPGGASVAIIGGGIAGLVAAHTFAKSGFDNFTIYEGSTRTGGRIYTGRNLMAPGLTTELGGEFIDSIHKDMLRLAREFDLRLLDTQDPSETALIKDAYFFNGQHFSLAQVVEAFRQIAPKMQEDIDSLPDSIDYRTGGAASLFDRLSISEYLTRLGATGWLKTLLEVAYETEYGLSPQEQSSINLLFLISTDTKKGQFDIFGVSDERYKIAGGNQQITDALTERYQSHIETSRVLKAIKPYNGGVELLFENAPAVRADYALLTLPFTKLRQVDIQVPLSAVKRQSIQQLGYGTNAKLMIGVSQRQWRTLGYSGYVFSDNGVQSGWDNSQLQPGTAGGFTVYLGGRRGQEVGNGAVQAQVQQYLPLLNQIFPGTQARANGNNARFHWPTHPFTLGSYACYKVGQWTSIGGAEGETAGRLFFAGEHCSADYQGYMNGGAETGRKAAVEMMKSVLA